MYYIAGKRPGEKIHEILISEDEGTNRVDDKRNYYIDKIEYFVGSMLSRRAMYEIQYGNVERAKVYLEKIQDDLPAYKIPPALQNILKEN